MTELLRRLLLFFWWPERKEPKKPRVRIDHKTLSQDAEEQGRWYYLSDLLERLDDYFVFIKFVKRHDKEAYALHHQVGGLIAARRGEWIAADFPASWRTSEGGPAFGMMMMSPERKDPVKVEFVKARKEVSDERMTPSFAYFRKMKPMPHVQRIAGEGDIYEMTLMFADFLGREREVKAKKKINSPKGDLSAPLYWFCHVSPQGKLKLLKVERPAGRKPHPRGRKGLQVWRSPRWEQSRSIEMLFGDRGNESWKEDETITEYAASTLRWLAQAVDQSSAGFLVRAKKNGVVATFAIDMLRSPYFFKDREVVVNKDGKKKKIFHIVRTHERHLRDGKVTDVKSHFRGLRKFTWNGYEIVVSMAGTHHGDMLDFRAEGIEVGDTEPHDSTMLDSQATGRLLAKHLDQ